MRARRKAIFFLILLVSSSLGLGDWDLPHARGAGANWLSGFTYRRSHIINGTATPQTDYPVEVFVFSGNGSASWQTHEDAPYNISDAPAVSYGGYVYIFGGYGVTADDELNITLRYEPSTDTYTQLADMPTARWGAGAGIYGDNIYVFGGALDIAQTPTNVTEVYDVSANTWTTETDIPSELEGQGQNVANVSSEIYIFYRQYTYIYNTTDDTFYQVTNANPVDRTWSTCGTVEKDGDICIYLIAGRQFGVADGKWNYYFNVTSQTWSGAQAVAPYEAWGTTRDGCSYDGLVYYGFGKNDANDFFKCLYAYDPASNTWSGALESAKWERDGVSSAFVEDKLVVYGGRIVNVAPYGVHSMEVYGVNSQYTVGKYVYLDGKGVSDWSDIRFTASDGDTLLDYAELYNTTDYAQFYCEVASLPTSTQTIYIYYGNTSTATSLSDGDATFTFWDGFPGVAVDPTKWTEYYTAGNGGTSTVAGGLLKVRNVDAIGDGIALKSGVTCTPPYFVTSRTLMKVAGNYVIFMVDDANANPFTTVDQRSVYGAVTLDGKIYTIEANGATFDRDNIIGEIDSAVYNVWTIERDASGNNEFYVNDVLLDVDYAKSTTDLAMFVVAVYITTTEVELDYVAIGKFVKPEPRQRTWGAEESASSNSAPVLGAYTISDWDGDALYTDGEFSNWWLQATDADGGADIATFETAFLLGSDWCNFTFTSSTGLWVKDTDGPITIQNDGQSDLGIVKNALGILAIEDWATPTENVVVYGRVTDASSATSGWGVLPGVGFSVREPGSSGDTGGYSDPGDDDEDDDEVDDEPIPECWMTNPDNLNAMGVDELRILADILGLPYTEDTTKNELVEAIYNEATRLCDEGENPFSGCLMDEEEKLAKLDYLMGLSVQDLRLECQSLGISYLLWRDPEPYIILIFTVGYHCSPPGDFDLTDWDDDGTPNWDDPDMFDETRKGIGARIEDIHLEESLPWIEGNGYVLIILLLVLAFFYSQVKKKDKPGSRGESLIRPRQGGYLPGERKK